MARATTFVLLLTTFTLSSNSSFAGVCDFGAAGYQAQLSALKDTQERRRELEKKDADARDANEIVQLGLSFVHTYLHDEEIAAARTVLANNKALIEKNRITPHSDTNVNYALLPKIVEGSVVDPGGMNGEAAVHFRQVGKPYYLRDHDGWSSNTWQYSNTSIEGVDVKKLYGKLIVFFTGYTAHAGVVAEANKDGITIIDLDGNAQHHFFTGDRGRYAGIGHLHVYDSEIGFAEWKVVQTQLLITPMLQGNGIIHPDQLPGDWQPLDKDDGLFVSGMSYKDATKLLEKLLRKKRGPVKLLLVHGNLNAQRILWPADIVELVGIDVTAPSEDGKVGIIVNRDGKNVRELYDISGKYPSQSQGIGQIFYLNE